MTVFLIVCPLIGIAVFVDAIAGGGGLISLPAYMLAGIPTHMAIGTNKMSSMMGTAVSTYTYFRKGYMKFYLCISGIITSLVGSFLGSHLSLYLDEKILKGLMLIVLPVAAFYVMRKNSLTDNPFKKELPLNYHLYDNFVYYWCL